MATKKPTTTSKTTSKPLSVAERVTAKRLSGQGTGLAANKSTSSGSKTIQLNGQTITATPYSQLNKPSTIKTTDTSATNQVKYTNPKTGASVSTLGGSARASQLEKQGYTLGGVTPTATDISAANPYGNWENQVKAQANIPFVENAKLGKDLGLKFETSAESYMKDKLRQQKEEMDYQQNLKAQQDRLEASDIKAQEKITKANIAGAEQAFGQNREGITSAGNAQVVGKFTSEANRQLAGLQERASMAENERSRILQKLEQAQKSDNYAMVDNYRAQLASAEQQLNQINLDKVAIEASQASTEKIKQETTFTNLEAMGSNVANLSTSELQTMGEQAGFTLPQMVNLQKGFQLRAEASEMKDEGAARYAQAQADELIQSVKFQAEDRPLDIRIKQAEARLMESKAVIEAAASTGKIIDPIKQAELAKQMYELNELRGYSDVSVPDGGDYAIAKTKDGIYVGVENGTYGGQCGAFVGNVNGKAFIPNLYTEKQKLIDPNIVVPVPGMVGISGSQKYPQYGHVFIVEQVNNDGTMNIVESNYYSPEKVGRRTIPIASADGFTRMPNAKTDQTNSDAGIYTKAQQAVMNSIDPTKITETQKKVLKENGLSSADLFNYISTSKKALPEEKKGDIQAVLDGINTLKEMKKSGAVGVSLQKLLPGVSAEKGFLPASKAADFKAEFDTFKDTLAIPTLDKLKGAMSDKDIQFLRNTATSLSLDMSEKQFEATLAKLEKKYKEILTQGTSIDPEQPKQNNDPLNLYTPTNDPLGLFN